MLTPGPRVVRCPARGTDGGKLRSGAHLGLFHGDSTESDGDDAEEDHGEVLEEGGELKLPDETPGHADQHSLHRHCTAPDTHQADTHQVRESRQDRHNRHTRGRCCRACSGRARREMPIVRMDTRMRVGFSSRSSADERGAQAGVWWCLV
eukprot:2068906-Rhodomonas_salina.1